VIWKRRDGRVLLRGGVLRRLGGIGARKGVDEVTTDRLLGVLVGWRRRGRWVRGVEVRMRSYWYAMGTLWLKMVRWMGRGSWVWRGVIWGRVVIRWWRGVAEVWWAI
jgi:hypothetical protein